MYAHFDGANGGDRPVISLYKKQQGTRSTKFRKVYSRLLIREMLLFWLELWHGERCRAVKKLVEAHVWKNPCIARHRCMREKDSRCNGGGIFPDVSMRDV